MLNDKTKWITVHTMVIPGYAQPKERARTFRATNRKTGEMETRTKTPKRTKAFEDYVELLGRTTYRGPLLTGAVRLDMVIRLKPPAKWGKMKLEACRRYEVPHLAVPDRTNIEKAVEDGLNKIVWKDDGQICAGEVLKYYHPDEGITLVISVLR